MTDVQGQWFGPLPLDGAEDCRVRIFATDTFDLECRGRTKYAAQGTWRRYADKLEMSFLWFGRDGAKAKKPDPWVFKVGGRGNTLSVGLDDRTGLRYEWRRAAP